MFKPVNSKINFSELEEELIKYWKENKIFEKSVESRPLDKKWTFLDGPPFVTGVPHYGSLLSSIPKDLFGRYWTMKGYRVRRVWGWDGHGLPIENKVEGKLEIKRKKDIEEVVGVKKFIEECKKYVNEVSEEWEWYVDHIGRWVDFENAYKTWNLDYMESVMWVFKQMYDKGFVYKGLRVSLYCPHCATPISNFEVAMDADNYRIVNDAATTYKYQMKDEKNTYILAWSTTPWNKIVTPALAVNPKLDYVKVAQGNEYYILAKSTLKTLNAEPKHQIEETVKGKELIGKKFVPHYDYYPLEPGEKAFEIIGGDFVTAEEGTGVVTIAVYGEEDLKAMKEQNIHIEMHLDEEGTVKPEVPLFGGMYYLKANKYVNEDLGKRNLIYKDENLPHNVPHCWRCHTRLYYAPQNAWYVDVQKLKNLLNKTNESVNWFPKHFKNGRFLKSLENAPDWNISRSRYWGSPVPVWECECGERFVPGSITELEKESGRKISDLHKPGIDDITVVCRKCGKTAKRVPEVLDSWIEAGSASFAERHFPFNQTEKLEDFYPPDFIAEYTGQIRAWFYVLHVIGGAIYETEAFKNVVVEGVILGTDGRKMSKNYGNYPDPREMIGKYGGDALRLYLMGSPVMHGEDIVISEEQYKNQVRGMMLILWNVYNFFVTYANIDKLQRSKDTKLQRKKENILDRWILSRLNNLIEIVTGGLDKYDTVVSIEEIKKFIDDLSTWYIRRSRDRVGPTAKNQEDKESFYDTTYTVLVNLTKLLAPVTPFITEEIYRNLTLEESVHLSNWPIADKSIVDPDLEEKMILVRQMAELGHCLRKEAGIKVRQPLRKLKIKNQKSKIDEDLLNLIKDELNVKEVEIEEGEGEMIGELDTTITDELKKEGEVRELIRNIQILRKEASCSLTEKIEVEIPSYPKEYEKYLMEQTLVSNILPGEVLKIVRINK